MDKDAVLATLAVMSQAENPTWETGQCSGTMYCGDHDHYDFLNEAFSYFSYVNSLTT
jgi:sphinganine-1-phosphate aldolase